MRQEIDLKKDKEDEKRGQDEKKMKKIRQGVDLREGKGES